MPNRVYTPPSPQNPPDHLSHTSSQSPSSPSACPRGEQKTTPWSWRKPSSPSSPSSGTSKKRHTRPKGPSRLSTGKGITTLERIWGPIFDEDGHPTVKLGQFLRGLALHIIEDYEPRHSLVITPKKMAKYYEAVKLPKEVYSWSAVFDCEYSSISRLYRSLDCPHHLVQERHESRPNIPSLTPVGFERWMTLFIQAHPEGEFERLRKAVLEMPISNPDDRKERFPKDISRRLFPDHEDHKVRKRIEDSMAERVAAGNHRRESQEETPPQPPQPPPPSENANVVENPRVAHHRRRSVQFADQPMSSRSSPTHVPSRLERERKLHSSSASDDTPSPPPSSPSHSAPREGKRHTARPEVAERFQDVFGRNKPRSESLADPALRLGRTSSTSSANTTPLYSNTQRSAESPRPGTPFQYRASKGARRHHDGGSTDGFRRSGSDARGYEQTL